MLFSIILLLLGLKENRSLYRGLHYIKVLLFCNDSYLRAVAKISSCWVNAVSRRGIVLSCVGISSFGSVFFLFPIKEARAHTHSTQVKSPAPPPQLIVTALYLPVNLHLMQICVLQFIIFYTRRSQLLIGLY